VEFSSSAVNLTSVIAVLIVAVSDEQIASFSVCLSVSLSLFVVDFQASAVIATDARFGIVFCGKFVQLGLKLRCWN
jgi:hypothetical protein